MKIKQSVINTFKRQGINYEYLLKIDIPIRTVNRFSNEYADTSALIAYCIEWVYQTSNDYENGINKVRIDDFDRIRYFVLEQDKNAYMTCLD